MSTASRGASRERQVAKLLEGEGWAVTRGAGSHGQADLWAARTWHHNVPAGTLVGMAPGIAVLRLLQIKTDKRGPFAHFGPTARQELAALAAQTGGTAELWHWPPNKPCKVYLEDQWPA